MTFNNGERWLSAIPMQYAEGVGFWDRDCGLLSLGFRELGADGRFVALGTPQVREDVPLILCTLKQMEEVAWWKQWGAAGVLLSAWAAPRYEPIARAIRASGTRLVVRCDSEGTKSPRVDFWRFLVMTYIQFRETRRWCPSGLAVLKTLLHSLSPAIHDHAMVRHLSHADLIVAESPIALQRIARLCCMLGRSDLIPRMRSLGHPVPAHFTFDPAVPKERRLVAVGRWDSYVKDAPLLVQTLGRVLEREPEYSAWIIGPGNEALRKLALKLPAEVRSRLEIVGRLPNRDLVSYYQRAQIICVTSRSESFHIASAEALCCGCTVVGPAILPSMHFFAGASSGTLAIHRSLPEMADAVLSEIEAWRRGQRTPASISAHWRQEVLASRVAEFIAKCRPLEGPLPKPVENLRA